MTARRDLARVTVAAERDLDRLHAPLGPAIAASVRRHAANGTITPIARLAILRDVGTVLDEVYPAKRGAPSRLEALVVRRAREAQRKPIAAAVADLRGQLGPALLTAMGDDGRA